MNVDRILHRNPDLRRQQIIWLCGLTGLLGCIAPNLTMVWGTVVARHDFIADTISDLGQGPHRIIMDSGFYINAVAMLALALGAALSGYKAAQWIGAIVLMILLAINIAAIGMWDAFGRFSHSEGTSVHTWLTFGLAPLYLLTPLALAATLRHDAPRLALLFVASAVLWIIFATAFKLAPTSIDGILEKIAVAATLLWTIPFALWLMQRGQSPVS